MDTTWKICRNKKRYATRAKANKQRRQGTLGQRKLYAYRCPACGQWHLTHYAPSEMVMAEQYGER
jgi:uncharacterized OB-fold protein